jgi:hypothetical protein
MQEHAFYHRKHCGICTDSQRQSQDREHGKTRCLPQLAHGIANFLEQRGHPALRILKLYRLFDFTKSNPVTRIKVFRIALGNILNLLNFREKTAEPELIGQP